VGLMGSIGPIGMILGPNLGGWMTTAFGWRSIFWINIPLCLIVLAVSAALMSKGNGAQSHFDLKGSGLMAVTIVALLVGVSVIGSAGNQASEISGGLLLALGLVTMVFFWRRTRSIKDPVIEPAILREKPFLGANAFNFTLGFLVGALTLIPLYAVSIYGLSTLASGVILTPRSLGMIAATVVTSLFILRQGYRWPMVIGTVLIMFCFVILSLEPTRFGQSGSQSNSTLLLLAVMGLEGISEGVLVPPANNACIELMPHRIATITSIRVLFRQVGSVAGITVGSVILHIEGLAQGFHFFFLGLVALIILIMLPAIFTMPNGK
jgi:MFS family permease